MQQQVLAFPVLPDKTEADARIIGDEFARRPDEYRESRRRHGISLERAYLQTTAMGAFVVVYGESEDGFDEATAAMAKSELPIDEFFVRNVREVHGFDMTQPMPGPSPETIGSWHDPDVAGHRSGMAFCAPLLPGTEEAGRTFIGEAFSSPDMTRSRRALGINREVVTVTQTPDGDIACVYIEGTDPVAGNAAFAASGEPFDLWFKEQLAGLFPPFVDFSKPVRGVVEIFDSATLN